MQTFNYQHYSTPFELDCDHCGEPFKEGEQAVELYWGVAGRGKNSGNSMVVEDKYAGSNTAVIHPCCILDFIIQMDETGEYGNRLNFCAGCGTKLNGED